MIALNAALLLLLAAPGGQDPTPADQRAVDLLIADLGSSVAELRQRAGAELKKMGKPAVPALLKAARSDDAERAMRARALLLEMAREHGKTPSSPAPRMSVVVEDWSKGILFIMAPDGSVSLTVPEKVEDSDRLGFKTYRAASLDEFKKQYPEIAQKADLNKILSLRASGDDQLRAWLGLRDDDEQSLEGRFGIMVRPVDPALASQLKLEEGEGLVVRRVERGSLAEKSGITPYDVIVKFNGENVQARQFQAFRESLHESVGTKEFSLEVLRNGKRETFQIMPEEKTPEAK